MKEIRFDRALLRLYAIIDPRYTNASPLDVARAVARCGATLLQVRGEGLSDFALYTLTCQLLEISKEFNVPLIVNDRADIARAAGAAGVHVGHIGLEDLPPDAVRRVVGPDAIVGVSVASVEEALVAESLGASYLSVGPIYTTASKDDAGAAVGLERIRLIRVRFSGPLCAIGGITPATAAEVIRAGADGVAVISALTTAADPEMVARDFLRKLNA
ncbi:MAG: thiamine phosphate synthase [Chloroflexi bacterium]|nr:thiamine phosphate synthase [Chloroflexota bacterium]MCL5947467.1 thiamine phosphate synthase [Chloroflexota bacterium]